jgi:hypothetical protein
MRETRSSGSVRGASGDGRPYRERSGDRERSDPYDGFPPPIWVPIVVHGRHSNCRGDFFVGLAHRPSAAFARGIVRQVTAAGTPIARADRDGGIAVMVRGLTSFLPAQPSCRSHPRWGHNSVQPP